MLDHLSLGVADLARAAAFYDALLAPLGYVRVWTIEKAIGYGTHRTEDKLAIKERLGARAPGNGFHLALTAHSREAVHASYEAGLAHGGEDSGAPGLRPHYGPGYYAAFVADPDGHRIEIVLHER